MSTTRKAVPIDPEFFCDGPSYLLTSRSLGGKGHTPEQISELIQSEDGVVDLVKNGVCLPIFFPGDCALDSGTLIVVGDLTEEEEKSWIGKLTAKLNIPCGKFTIVAGGGDPDELAYAISGEAPKEHYRIFNVIDVPPGEYLLELLAYFPSVSVQMKLDEEEELEEYLTDKFGSADDEEKTRYIIRLGPLKTAPPAPKLVEDIGWLGEFEFRHFKQGALS